MIFSFEKEKQNLLKTIERYKDQWNKKCFEATKRTLIHNIRVEISCVLVTVVLASFLCEVCSGFEVDSEI